MGYLFSFSWKQWADHGPERKTVLPLITRISNSRHRRCYTCFGDAPKPTFGSVKAKLKNKHFGEWRGGDAQSSVEVQDYDTSRGAPFLLLSGSFHHIAFPSGVIKVLFWLVPLIFYLIILEINFDQMLSPTCIEGALSISSLSPFTSLILSSLMTRVKFGPLTSHQI